MESKTMERYFFFGLLLGTLIFTLMILRPFLAIIVVSASFAVVFYPMYKWLENKKIPDWVSALLVVMFFIVVLFLPALWIGSLIFHQSANLYISVVYGGSAASFLSHAGSLISRIMPSGATFDLSQQISYFVSLVSYNITALFSFTISTVLSLFLLLLCLFYFLKDGARWQKMLIMLSPLSAQNDEKILHRLSMSIKGVIVGSLLMSLIQGILLGIGYTFFGVPNGTLWGVVAFFVSFIPVIGTGLVSIPAVIYLLVQNNIPAAIGMGIWAIAEVLLVANFVSPVVLGRKADFHPLLMLFAILGGVSFFGPVGILIGPLVISLLYSLVSIYRDEFKQNATF